jgi:putative transposase
VVQTYTIQLMGNSLRYSARQDWDAISWSLKPVYQAATVAEAEERFLEFQEEWGSSTRGS